MMPMRNLTRMVVANTLRSRRHFILSAFGIVIGISTFVVFLASTEQVGKVLEKIFPLDQVQVVAPRASLLGTDALQMRIRVRASGRTRDARFGTAKKTREPPPKARYSQATQHITPGQVVPIYGGLRMSRPAR